MAQTGELIPATRIRLQLPECGFASLKVFDIFGGEVRTLVEEIKESGVHIVEFEAAPLPSGLLSFKSGGFVDVKKMLLVK